MEEQIVVIGAGHAGISLSACLREEGYEGRIWVIGAEEATPYHRPPLSKEFMTSAQDSPRTLRDEHFYRDNDIDLMLGETVNEVDLERRRVVVGDGREIRFGRLAIATGASPRRLALAGDALEGVCYLRNVGDAAAIRARLGEAEHVVVIGGGFLGLEVAATLGSLGHSVTVFEAGRTLMGRAVSPEVASHFLRRHREWGVDVVLDDAPESFVKRGGALAGVTTSRGRSISATTAIIGVGVTPETRLAERAGLRCRDGIEVDASMRAGADWVVAAGDCARFPRAGGRDRVRIESVQNASDQARTAAASLLGRPAPFSAVPWFWSSQRDERLQIAGLIDGPTESVVRGHVGSGRFSVFRFRGDRLVAVDSVNRPGEHIVARKLLRAGRSPTREQAGDPEFELKGLISS